MDQADFIRRITATPGKFSWFLGAGASQSAGLPTAVDLIWNLKRRYYISEEHQEISSNDLQNPAVRAKIDSYMLSRGFPETSDPTAYSKTFELSFKDDYKRQREHLEGALSEGKSAPALGHRIFAALIAMGTIKAVFTTNFDTIVERSLAEVAGKALAPFHLEGSYAANDAINNEAYPVYVKLHGDFRYLSLKNLSVDLQSQNDELGKAFINAASRFGFVVAGYSGRDESVIGLFRAALETHNPFPHGLYWTGLKGRPPLPAVLELLESARQKGVTAEYIEIETFDSLLSRIWKLTADKPSEYVAKIGKQGTQTVSIPMSGPGTGALLRLNALPIVGLSEECLELTFTKEMDWDDLRAGASDAKGSLICTKGAAIWAWGSESAIRAAFPLTLSSAKPARIAERIADLRNNLHLKPFVEQAIGRGLCRGKLLIYRHSRNVSNLIVDRKATPATAKPLADCVGALHGAVAGMMTVPTDDHPTSEQVYWAEALRLEFEVLNGAYWLVLKPDIWIWPRHARDQAREVFIDPRVKDRLNKKADALLTAWISILFPNAGKATDQVVKPYDGPNDAAHPAFTINTRTAFSKRRST